MQKETHVNTNYKDRLFIFIFGSEENREWTLSLYNAINGSHYTDASQIIFNTLENALFIGMKNDTSFIISDTINLYEHQSTYNPNMPLRFLGYISELYSSYIKESHLNPYGTRLIRIPTPKLVVFYNGLDETEDESILKLSDSFIRSFDGEPDIEIRVRTLNVNYGRNDKIMNLCKPLRDYAWFIASIRKYQAENYSLSDATRLALADSSDDFVLKPFLEKNKAKVDGMLLDLYNEENFHKMYKYDIERAKAEAAEAEARADAIEAELKKLKEENEKLRAQISQ
jgi:hypothetical protein